MGSITLGRISPTKSDHVGERGRIQDMEVIEINGVPYVKDAVGVCMPIPEKETDFNCTDFDFVIE